jgi:nitrogen fixation/metabolism regulation signal transduction histidine kinase
LKLARLRDWPLRWKLLGLLAAVSAVPFAVTSALELQRSLVVHGAILGLALAGGLLLARSILSPIQALTRAARSIREGDLSPEVDVRSRDELGELASAFDAMAASLRAGREELEEKVRVRTKALESAMESLEARNQTLSQRTAELTHRQHRDGA